MSVRIVWLIGLVFTVLVSMAVAPLGGALPTTFKAPPTTYLLVYDNAGTNFDIRSQSDVALLGVGVNGVGVTAEATGTSPLFASNPVAVYECTSPSGARKAMTAYMQVYAHTHLYDEEDALVGILVASNSVRK